MRRILAAVLTACLVLPAARAWAQHQPRAVFVAGAPAWSAALGAPSGSTYLQGLSSGLRTQQALESLSFVLARAELDPAKVASLAPAQQESLIRETVRAYAARQVQESSRFSDRNSPKSLIESSQALHELADVRAVFPQDVPAEVERSQRDVQSKLDRRYENLALALNDKPNTGSLGAYSAAVELGTLGRTTDLPGVALTALAEAAVNGRNRNISADAVETLYQHRALPAPALEVLRRSLEHDNPEARLAAAKLILLHQPDDAKARETIRRRVEAAPPAMDWRDLTFATLEAGRDPAGRAVDPAQIKSLARERFRKWAPEWDEAAHDAIERFLERASRYTESPRRLYKLLNTPIERKAVGGGSFWDEQLRDPAKTRLEDLEFQAKTIALLKADMPEILAATNRERESRGEPGEIAGVLLVGSFIQGHPTAGSDLDIVPVVKGGIPTDWKTYDLSLRLHEHLDERKVPIRDSDWLEPVGAGSLKFQEYASLGAVFIPAANR
jgi:hypothetical protein